MGATKPLACRSTMDMATTPINRAPVRCISDTCWVLSETEVDTFCDNQWLFSEGGSLLRPEEPRRMKRVQPIRVASVVDVATPYLVSNKSGWYGPAGECASEIRDGVLG